MLYEICRELAAALKEQRVPFPVVFGPERTQTVAITHNRIVIDHAGPGADAWLPPKSVHKNPNMPAIRQVAAVLRIYAQDTTGGAAVHLHRRLAEQVLDHVVAELSVIMQRRREGWAIASGGFTDPADMAATERHHGALYEARLTFDRGVYRATWKGEAEPEASLGAVTSTTEVRLQGAPPGKSTGEGNPPETACGG